MFNNFFFYKIYGIYEIMWKNLVRTGQATDDSILWHMLCACCLWLRLQIHTQNIYYLLLLGSNNGYMNTPHYSSCKAPLFLNLGTRWRWVVNLMPRLLFAWHRTAVGTRAGLDVSEKRKFSWTYQTQTPDRLVHSAVAIPTAPLWLLF